MERSLRFALSAMLLASSVAWAGQFEDGLAAMERGDYIKAATLFQPLATAGNALAQYNLGLMYEKGRGVPQDYAGAVSLYQLAAAQGNAEAQRNLGVMYRDGLGVQKDPVRAHMWLNLGAAESAANAASYRDALVKTMKPEQIVLAQKLANECRQRGFKGCDSPQSARPAGPAAASPEAQ
ncbi:MAG: tetratricopeptide repeat protein [Sulfuricella sp.]